MQTLAIDIETYSDRELKTNGVYKYCQSPEFDILLFAYSIDGGEVQIIETINDGLPQYLIDAIRDDRVIKTAYNANFERVCLSAYLKTPLKPNSWQCTMLQAGLLGLPMSLKGVGSVLQLDKEKMDEGTRLINYFSKPCTPTKVNGGRTRNLPEHNPEKWQTFIDYCKRDVEVEMAIREKLLKYPIPEEIQKEYILDQEINDRGIAVDMDVVSCAITCEKALKNRLMAEMRAITNLQNPNAVGQMKEWLVSKGLEIKSLDKEGVKELIETAPQELQPVLKLRQQLAKSSVRKYTAMKNAVCADGRLHGMFQFYGANRTGRWAGRLVQLQNLPQNHIENLTDVRQNLTQGYWDDITTDDLSELVRTAFIPSEINKFIVADFSAIEARVLSWFADETWRMDVFRGDGKIYEASASRMFNVPIEEITKTSPLRQKGKIAELALGYGGSVGALKAMGAISMGLTEDELQPLVDKWRQANSKIVQFWYAVDSAIKYVVKNEVTTQIGSLLFEYSNEMLFIKLPSGRKIAYYKPRLEDNRFGFKSVTYEGLDTMKKWNRQDSYGAKFVENIVQATSRDLLMFAMQNLSDYAICGHVHDEVIIEAPLETTVDEIISKMTIVPKWAEGLPLKADGYECKFYRKD